MSQVHDDRLRIRVCTVRVMGWSSDFPSDKSALSFLEWLTEVIATIPKEYQHTAKINITAEGAGDDCVGKELSITYLRPETDQEYSKRKQRDLEHLKLRQERELETYRALKLKYGNEDI